uniref:Uncharacterized protein n=1 Tax=Glossina pallidipes TaxID=7398 RepID=A0A1A9ZQJ1_GLOPL
MPTGLQSIVVVKRASMSLVFGVNIQQAHSSQADAALYLIVIITCLFIFMFYAVKELYIRLYPNFKYTHGLANLAKAFWSVKPIKLPGPGFSLPFANATMTLSSSGTLAAKLAKSIAAVAVSDESMNGPVFAEPKEARRTDELLEVFVCGIDNYFHVSQQAHSILLKQKKKVLQIHAEFEQQLDKLMECIAKL